jgi:outer membrane murein-binding lipoprotein Lpp
MDTDIELSEAGGQKSDVRAQMSDVRCQKSDVRFFHLLSSVFCLCVVAGCENANSIRTPLVEQIGNLTEQNKQLENQLEQTRAENKKLTKQMHVLSGLPEEVKGENLYRLEKIEIGKYTGFFDKDDDGTKEKLIVYIQPIDEEGDIIKATGAVDVQLWDLDSSEADQALLGQWHVEPGELKKLWFATLVTINYRLTFDIADKVKSFDEPLTVKVTFTDYLSGKVFKEQKVIKPQSP